MTCLDSPDCVLFFPVLRIGIAKLPRTLLLAIARERTDVNKKAQPHQLAKTPSQGRPLNAPVRRRSPQKATAPIPALSFLQSPRARWSEAAVAVFG